MIQLNSISLQRGNKVLLEDASLTVFPGQTWGIVGANGSGKSTLFKLLLGEISEDAGSRSMPANWQIAHMAQEISTSTRSALDYVIDGDAPYRDVEGKINSGKYEGEALAQLYQEMENIDGYTVISRAERLLRGLGFSSDDSTRNTGSFSGGWRIRLNLAQALMCRSDLLLLDEPTNHLDLDATVWLEQWLRQYSGTLLIISHDREFLDNLAESIAHIENAQFNSYSGNYSAFESQRAERLAQQAVEFQKQQQRISEIEDFVRRFRAKASKAKQAQSRLKELERMEKISPAHVDSPFTFRFPEPERLPTTLLSMAKLDIGYPGKTVLPSVNLSLLSSHRIGLLGHNGAGKSSLMKTLAGEIKPLSGEVVEGTHLKIGYFAQHQLEHLDLEASCALHIQRLSPSAREQDIRNFLGSFGFQGDRAFETIRHFSGGEKARLALALLAWQKPNLLLLDEPTNHLDLEVRHALELALQAFSGAIVIVSHDRHLLRSTVDEFLLVGDGRIEPFEGTLEDYHKWLLDKDKTPAPTSAAANEAPRGDKKELRQQEAAIRTQLAPHNKRIKQLEQKLSKATEKLEKVESRLADPEIYNGDGAELSELLKTQATLKQEVDDIELAWMEESEAKEALEASIRAE
ncbi:ATP-binding cassette domain-containing protein [Teredinibacter turnerae]|uniref:ATP-binding cassette domain-containing protein n=1 Tax=Teredinibacter turnerae TaxID=2426 RepID=UPI0003F86BD5|nr:ATP-binding cassette domain-containing protein [Teredinibacter turnerae]